MDYNNLNMRELLKMSHAELVRTAQRLKNKNNRTIDRLYFKYSKQLKELDIDYIRERITQDTSDEKLMQHIQDAYSNLTLGGGGKLGAKELKEIETFNKNIADIDEDYYEVLYNHFLEMSAEEQINEVKTIIGSDTAYNENMFKGSRIQRTNKIMQYMKNNNLIEFASGLLL